MKPTLLRMMEKCNLVSKTLHRSIFFRAESSIALCSMKLPQMPADSMAAAKRLSMAQVMAKAKSQAATTTTAATADVLSQGTLLTSQIEGSMASGVVGGGAASSAKMSLVKQRELARQRKQITGLQKVYNEQFSQIKEQEEEIEELKSRLQGLENQQAAFVGDLKVKTEGQIFIEQAQVDVVKMDTERKMFLKRQDVLRHMLTRLKLDELTHRNKMVELQAQYDERLRYAKQLQLISRDLLNGKDVAEKRLKAIERACKKEHRLREVRLKERLQLVDETQDVLQIRQEGQKRQMEILAAAQGDLDVEKEEELLGKHTTLKMKNIQAKGKLDSTSTKIAEFENAFAQIREATGINDVNELVEKYGAQDRKKFELTQMIDEGLQEIGQLRDRERAMLDEVEEIRFSGLGHLNKQRQELDDQEEVVGLKAQELEDIAKRNRFLQDAIQDSVTGVQHLCKRLEDIKEPEGYTRITDVIRENVIEAIQLCGAKGVSLREKIQLDKGMTISEFLAEEVLRHESMNTARDIRVRSGFNLF